LFLHDKSQAFGGNFMKGLYMNVFEYLLKKRFTIFIFVITCSLILVSHAMKSYEVESVDPDGMWKEFTIDEDFYFESVQNKACTGEAKLAFSPNADYLFSVVLLHDRKQAIFCLWKLGEKKPHIMTKACLYESWKDPYNFCFSSNGNFLAVKNADKYWCIYSLASGKLIKTVAIKNVKPIFLSNDLFFIKSKKETYHVFCMKKETCIKDGDFTNITQCDPLNKYLFFKNKINNANLYHDESGIILPNKVLYATVEDEEKKIRIFDNDDQVLRIWVNRKLEYRLEPCTEIKFSAKGNFVAIHLDDHSLYIYNLKTNELSMTAENVCSFDFNPCENVVRIDFFHDYSHMRGYLYKYDASKNLYANKDKKFQDQTIFKKENCDMRIYFNN